MITQEVILWPELPAQAAADPLLRSVYCCCSMLPTLMTTVRNPCPRIIYSHARVEDPLHFCTLITLALQAGSGMIVFC